MSATFVKVKTIMDETAASTTYFAAAGRPNTSFTMAATTLQQVIMAEERL